MARPSGSRNPGYEDRRRRLALAALPLLVDAAGQPSTFKAIARGASVSVPTLKHYFGDLDGVVAAALAVAEEEGAVHLAQLADPGDLPLEASLHAVVSHFVLGWRLGVGDLFEGALTHGLRHPTRGPAAVQHLLEPSLVALEARLAVHRARGQLDAEADLREAALAFLSPLMVGLLHQDGLGGARCRPLDVTAFGRTHVARFVRGWRPS